MEPHIKYQSLSRCEAIAILREVETRVQTAHDQAMQAGYDSGVDYAINHLIPINAGSTDCRISGCKNYHDGSQGNCKEGLIAVCESFVSESPRDMLGGAQS